MLKKTTLTGTSENEQEKDSLHPRRLTWNINNGGLEDDFPFQIGDFLGSMLIFQGVVCCLPLFQIKCSRQYQQETLNI